MPVKQENPQLIQWMNTRLSEILDFPASEDLTMYILSIENTRDLEDYLRTLLNFSNPIHRKFYKDLLQRRQYAGSSDVQAYKKSEEEENYIHPKQTDKKKKNKGNVFVEEKPTFVKENSKEGSTNKKKSKFVNLYSQEGLAKDIILLKGRHKCDCQASKHKLINNCLDCGRIVCEQEGSGPCIFCGSPVYTPEEMQILQSGKKEANTLYQQYAEQKNQVSETAIEQRNRLLEYDRTSERRTRVIDDESDYFSAESVWLSKEEREKIRKKEEELRDKRHGSRLNRKVTLDFAGRQIVEEDPMNELFEAEDIILKKLSESVSNPHKSSVDINDVHPGLTCPQPVFIPDERDLNYYSHIPEDIISGGRVQDKEFLEMSDNGSCLSMHQPWASLLVRGIKEHEGRMWYTAHRGRLWIASTSKPCLSQEVKEMENMYRVLKGENLNFPDQYPTSCLLGCVNVVDCLPQEEYRSKFPEGESDSPFVFICEDHQELPIKFPIQGKHKIYKLDSKIHQAAQKALQRVAKQKSEIPDYF